MNNSEIKFILKNFFIHKINYTIKDKIIIIFCRNYLKGTKILNEIKTEGKKILNNVYKKT